MKTSLLKKAGIPSAVVLVIIVFYLYITANGFSFYHEGIGS